MKLSGECANFEIDTGGTNYFNAPFTGIDMTFTLNVDMRQVLGDLYQKYDKFLIVFNGIGMFSALSGFVSSNGATGLNNTAVWTLGMSGLDWINNSYNGNMNTIAYFPNRFTMPTNNYAVTNSISNNGVCFRRPDNPYVKLTVAPYLTRNGGYALGAQSATSGTGGWDINYSFTIFGLTE